MVILYEFDDWIAVPEDSKTIVAATEIPRLPITECPKNNGVDVCNETISEKREKSRSNSNKVNPRANKVHPGREDEKFVEKIAEKLQSPAFEAFLNQRVSLTTDQMDKIEFARLQANVERLPPRYPSQDSYLRKDIHHLYFTNLHANFTRLEDPSFEQQRYCMSSEKEEILYAQRIFKRLSRALKLRMASQDADLLSLEQKKEIRFKEIEENLNQLVEKFPRFENQRVMPRSTITCDS
ncbi:12147_t:CDS:2 [Acaulospora colombiana]|uniref:12147_t:CDS:1 n=1 Tax=Acaulospora colombiana TaxID=27376 RepID=A0ACA9KCQ7_9GLOM|nr:12147_t:CDS:2 [Acaulospora colombiana]